MRPPLGEQEPFATIRAYPRRFGWGIPLIFAASLGGGLVFVGRSLSLAIAVQLALQTAGLLWLYVPAVRRRVREEETAAGRADSARGGAGARAVRRSAPGEGAEVEGLPDDDRTGHG